MVDHQQQLGGGCGGSHQSASLLVRDTRIRTFQSHRLTATREFERARTNYHCVNREAAMVAPGTPGRPSSLIYAIWTAPKPCRSIRHSRIATIELIAFPVSNQSRRHLAGR